MTYLTNLKEFGVKATVLASSLALIACGGGGGGYYGDDNKNTGGTGGGTDGNGSTTDPKKVVESLGLSIQNSEAKPIEVAYDNSKILISVQALNRDKGGVADKLINLSIADNENLGVTSKSSQVTTGDNGIAVFELNIPTISTASGKVQLTATVDGTTIKQIYTLNIKKTSTIQSEYNLKIQQGVMLNLPKGTASITAQVTDKNGGVKPNQTVSLVLPVEMQGKFSIATGSSLITDSSGNAIFTIVANSDLTAEDITKLASTSANLDFKLVDEFKAESQAKASITFKDITQVVQKLEIVTEDNPIIAQGGTTKVIVVAKNSDGNLLTNKKVKLSFTDSSAVYGVTIDQPGVITDAKGYATFTLKSASSYPIALSQQGINLKAVYSESADIFATSTVKVTTADTGASNQLGLQRLEIASSYQINAKNDSITITVKGINNKGEAATQGKVKLSLNAEATSNGVTFDGSAEQEFKTGYVTYTLKTNAKTPAAVAALVAAGITATFTADNNISNNIKIAVEDEAQSEEALSFLAIDPINTAYDYTKDQTIVVKVKATGVKGGALKGETINLGFSKSYSVSELQNLGLSLTSSADALTDATGYATFTYSYKASGSSAQKALVENGLGLIAKPANGTGAASTANLNFKAPTAQGEIDLDHLNVGIPAGSVILGINEEHNISVSVDAMGTDGKVLPNQKVSIGLNDAAISNGVSFGADTTSTMVTNSEGKTIFNLRIKASNTTELANLVSNGLTIAIKGQRKDGSAYTVTRKIEIAQPVVLIPDLAALSLNYDVQTVSVLGGEVRVKVIAKDENGVTIPNTPVAIALSSLAGSRVSLSDTTVTTNSKGEAQFTLKVSEGLYDANLIKNGITFAVVGTNLNNGDRIQQTGTIQVAIPQDSVNLRLTADKKELEFGKSYQVQVAVKDELGANTGYPVNLVLNKEAYDAGIRLSNDSLVTAANGQTPITITIPKDIPSAAKQALINLGSKAIQIKGTIKNPKGVDVISTLEFSVFEAVNPNHLTIASSKASLSVTGDKTIVTVQLLDNNGLPVRDEDVSLAANNSATLIIGTPGDGHPTNTSKPQTVKTDSNGNAFFSVEVDGNTADADLLLSSGVELTASNTNANGALSTQIYRLTAFKPSPTAPQAARYNLRIESNKATLNVRNDLANVTVTLVDQNGGGVANKYISLSIKDFIRNGAIIVGASGLTTDQNGQAVFKVKIDESARSPSYTAAAFDADDLNLAASFSETGYLDATQISRIDVVQSVVQNPIASIVIGVNPTETGSSNDGVYYTKNLSVSVVDFNGKPLANQKVEMDINPTNYIKGRYVWALAPVPGSNPVLKWVGPGDNYYLDNPNNYIDSTGTVMNNNGTPADTSDDFSVSPVVNPSRGCAVSSPYNAITNSEVTSIPVKVPTFLGQGATATYTTDADGKFDFVIRYPKIYAQWLSVQIGASSQVATLPFRTTYNLGLASVASDYSTNGTFGPNLKSPYGINTITCP